MKPHFRRISSIASIVLMSGLLSASRVHAAGDGGADPDANYDRMDGTGASGKTVNVIEWEGNLEIHVAPPGSLKGLALKLDKKNKDKPVMVIGYRFDNDPSTQLIRRAILGIELRDGFKVYRDKSVPDYDKIVITNNTLSSTDLAAYRLDPDPKQLYPDGSPALAQKGSGSQPSSGNSGDARAPASAPSQADAAATEHRAKLARQRLQEDGTITPFFGNRSPSAQRGGQSAGTIPSAESGEEAADE